MIDVAMATTAASAPTARLTQASVLLVRESPFGGTLPSPASWGSLGVGVAAAHPVHATSTDMASHLPAALCIAPRSNGRRSALQTGPPRRAGDLRSSGARLLLLDAPGHHGERAPEDQGAADESPYPERLPEDHGSEDDSHERLQQRERRSVGRRNAAERPD